jgi:hypothetical protein
VLLIKLTTKLTGKFFFSFFYFKIHILNEFVDEN